MMSLKRFCFTLLILLACGIFSRWHLSSYQRQTVSTNQDFLLTRKAVAATLGHFATVATSGHRERVETSRHPKAVTVGYPNLSKDVPSPRNKMSRNETRKVTPKRLSSKEIVMKYANHLDLLPTKPFNGLKAVHMDLKGSPPTVDYMIKFMKEAKHFGANGFLMEYEDMFPYYGELSILARKTAYSKTDLPKILQTAENLQMEIIPLVQTYGHLEFVLKHDKFKHLRRTQSDIKSINSASKESVPLIKSMIDQILEFHPNIRWFHIGGDEVANLDKCDGCSALRMSAVQIYHHHMMPIIKYIRSKRNQKGESITPILWDDMMRRWAVKEIQIITELAVPMVWAYTNNLNYYRHFPPDMWDRYIEGMNSQIFFASAFKGAAEEESDILKVEDQANNNKHWLAIISMFEMAGKTVSGIVLTGWSRFMHTFPMCEILPVGTPSLALCLEILRVGRYDSDVAKNVSNTLGMSRIGQKGLMKNPQKYEITTITGGKFLGSDAYLLVERLVKYRLLLKGIKINVQTEQNAKTYIKEIAQIKHEVEAVFPKYFYHDTIEEWVNTKIMKTVNKAMKELSKFEGSRSVNQLNGRLSPTIADTQKKSTNAHLYPSN